MKNISPKDRIFTDHHGRHVILHGINMVNKDYTTPMPHSRKDFEKVRSWGFNCIRLGILWKLVEPEPGRYDESYLDLVEKRINWASDLGMHVFLDMHQDCFSYTIKNGETGDQPDLEWFARTDGLVHENPGSVWSDAYLTSPATKRMFDNFWANKPAQDRIGLQDHYAEGWRMIAKRFAGHPAVIGYNIMNEPNPGSLMEKIWAPILIKAVIGFFFHRGKLILNPEKLVDMWLDADKRQEVTGLFNNVKLFRWILDGGKRRLHRAEKKLLYPFYSRVAAAIRKEDKETMLMFEPFSAEFMGLPSALPSIKSESGKTDPNQSYVPHIYDVVVDTGNEDAFNTSRVEMIAGNHVKDSERMNLPVIIGEWGAYNSGFGDFRAGTAHSAIFEKHLWSDTYWCYHEQCIPEHRYFPGICRPLVLAAPGRLQQMKTDEESGTFRCRWSEPGNNKLDAELFIPGDILDLKGGSYRVKEKTKEGSFIHINPLGRETERELTVTFSRNN